MAVWHGNYAPIEEVLTQLARGKQGNANEKWRIIDRQSDVVAYEHRF